MKHFTFIASLLLLAGCSSQAVNNKTASVPGYESAKLCIACHGANGIDGKQDMPPIGHMSADELIAATARLSEAHFDKPILAHSLTDAELREIAKYFAAVNKQ